VYSARCRCSAANSEVLAKDLKDELYNLAGNAKGLDMPPETKAAVVSHMEKFNELGSASPEAVQLQGTEWSLLFTNSEGVDNLSDMKHWSTLYPMLLPIAILSFARGVASTDISVRLGTDFVVAWYFSRHRNVDVKENAYAGSSSGKFGPFVGKTLQVFPADAPGEYINSVELFGKLLRMELRGRYWAGDSDRVELEFKDVTAFLAGVKVLFVHTTTSAYVAHIFSPIIDE
jgi:hypothetical protein